MKKSFFLIGLLFILIISGCNEKDLLNQIGGTWHIQKYTTMNGQQNLTHWYDSTHVDFNWNFSGSNFTITYLSPTLFTVNNYDTIGHINPATHSWVLDSITHSQSVIPGNYPVNIQGTWILINGNAFIQTMDSATGNHQYQIVSHSSGNLHLAEGSDDYYLSK